MRRVTCTCKPSELLVCAYCRVEYHRTLALAMKSPDGPIRMRLFYVAERRAQKAPMERLAA